MKKVSVIIPVYNVEEYLEDCLNSIINQSIGIKNIEVIIINDGSSDNSINIVNEYKKKYSDWIVVDRVNKGVSISRNEGIELATTKYLMFLDSDDYLDKDTLKEMYEIIEKESADVVMGRMRAFNSKGFYTYYSDKIITKYEVFNLKEKKNAIKLTSVCCKLYKKELIKDIKFPPNLRHEDNYFSVSVCTKAKKMVAVPKHYYYRRYREGENPSFMQNLSLNTFKDLVENYYLYFQDNPKNRIVIKFSYNTFNNYIISRLSKNEKKEARKIVKNYLKYLVEKKVLNKLEYYIDNIYQTSYYCLASLYYKMIKIIKK